MNGYMILDNGMKDGNYNQYKIGENYKDKNNLNTFEFYETIYDLAVSNIPISKFRIVEIYPGKNLTGSYGCFNTSEVTILREVNTRDIMDNFQDIIRNLNKGLKTIGKMIECDINANRKFIFDEEA